MGLFGSKEQIDLAPPGEVAIAEHVASVIPDAGEYFLDWIGDLCNEQMFAALKAEVDSRRGPNGWVIASRFDNVPQLGRKQTPMTFLRGLVGGLDAINLSVWGTSANRGKDYRTLASTLEGLVRTQGHGAAATWAICARPQARLSLDLLADGLANAWGQSHGFLRNQDLIRAFKNWEK